MAHIEIVSAILYQLTRDLTPEQIKESGFDSYFVDHTTGIYPQGASGVPFTAAYLQSTGDPITDLTEDLAAEQKARTTYDNILRLCDDPDVRDPIKYLRQREIVHFQRFGEALRIVQDDLRKGVHDVTYTIMLDVCGSFLISENKLLQIIKQL